jgi:hypothetical protein
MNVKQPVLDPFRERAEAAVREQLTRCGKSGLLNSSQKDLQG